MVEVGNQPANHTAGHVIGLFVVPLESEVVVDAQSKQRSHRLQQMLVLTRADVDGLECVRPSFELVDHGREFDDLSGGATILSIPSLTDLAPAAGNALPPGAFTSYADISADQRSAYFPLGPGPYKSYVSSIDLAIDPFYGGSQVFAGQDLLDALHMLHSLTKQLPARAHQVA